MLVGDWTRAFAAELCSTAAPNQLTWSCGDVCDDYVPCRVFDSIDDCDSEDLECLYDADQVCVYACYHGFYYQAESALLLIPFGSTYESEEEVAERKAVGDAAYDALIDAMANDTSDYAWIKDDLLDSIGSVDLDPSTTELCVL